MSMQFNTGNSWWPLFISVSVFMIFMNLLNFMVFSNLMNLMFSFVILLMTSYFWFRDLMRESTTGVYNLFMQTVFKTGMVMFILSEIMFFFSFFWTFFHFMFMFNGEFGFLWPPMNITSVNYMSIPLLNTLLLLSSGLSLTLSHNFILLNQTKVMSFYLLCTIMLGVIFTSFQLYEYSLLEFLWSSSSYGSIFYMGTGFHGIHVLLGTSMLTFLYINKAIMNLNNGIFDMIAWYWHFVDMVWILLFTEFYWWSY